MRDRTAVRKHPRQKPNGHLDQANLEASLRELSSQVVALQDQERRRIARDLHDSLGQMVVLLKMNLERIGTVEKIDSEHRELVSHSLNLADRMSTELRTICYLLHPPLLDELGLVAALKNLAEGFSQRSGVETSLQIDGEFTQLSSESEISVRNAC